MTKQQFAEEYKTLEQVWPMHFGGQAKYQIIWEYLQDLDQLFLRALIKRMVLSSDPFLNIEEAARGERLARQKQRDTEAMMKLEDQLKMKMDPASLDKTLRKIGETSLWGAVKAQAELARSKKS